MLRTFLVAVCRLLLRVFFRRIEISGKHHIPEKGSVVFALNHPSGLVDPLFVLCLSGRRVSFLAKEPLFQMPLIGTFVRAFECLPVYRPQDGADPKKNREMMKQAADLLRSGNALALFPEGTSHNDPKLKPFRTGAARIALSARALGKQDVKLVPAALYYEEKKTFRSRAVLAFGDPIEVPEVELNEHGNSPVEAGKALTSALEKAIAKIMPTANTLEGLALAEDAERVFNAALRDTPRRCPTAVELVHLFQEEDDDVPPESLPTLAERMSRRRQLIDGYERLVHQSPDQVQALIERIGRIRRACSDAALPIDAPPRALPLGKRRVFRWVLSLVALAPLAAVGIPLHFPAYRLIRVIAFKYPGEEDAQATVKLVAGLLLFPLSWLVLAVAGWIASGALAWGFLALLLGPVSGWAALVFTEILGALLRRHQAGERVRRAPMNWNAITEERAAITEEMAQLLTRA